MTNINVRAINLLRGFAAWGALITVTLIVPFAAFLAMRQLFNVDIPLNWKSYIAFWVLVLILKVDIKFTVQR